MLNISWHHLEFLLWLVGLQSRSETLYFLNIILCFTRQHFFISNDTIETAVSDRFKIKLITNNYNYRIEGYLVVHNMVLILETNVQIFLSFVPFIHIYIYIYIDIYIYIYIL